MSIYLIGFVLTLLAVLGISVGILFGRPPIAGSCGGLGGGSCQSCKRECPKHVKEQSL